MLKSLLLAQRTTKDHFKMPLSFENTVIALTAAYQAEVEYRRRQCMLDDQTKTNISAFAKFLTNGNKFGAIFSGICGNGKTTLLYAFRNLLNYLNQKRMFPNTDTGIIIVDAKDIAEYAKDLKRFHDLRSQPLLAIEDMGREPVEVMSYGNVLNPVIDLLEYRYNQQLFTLITTNLIPQEIRERYGNRIADRFNEMLDILIFGNKTYRR